MEKELSNGIFISVITKEQMQNRAMNRQGEELKDFVSKCNKFELYSDLFYDVIGLHKDDFLEVCLELNPEFNADTDYFIIRYNSKS